LLAFLKLMPPNEVPMVFTGSYFARLTSDMLTAGEKSDRLYIDTISCASPQK